MAEITAKSTPPTPVAKTPTPAETPTPADTEVAEKPELAPELVGRQTREELEERYPGYEIPEYVQSQSEREDQKEAAEAKSRDISAARGADVDYSEWKKMSPDQKAAAIGIGGAGWAEKDLAHAIAHPEAPEVKKEIARIRAAETPVSRAVLPKGLTPATRPDRPGGQVATIGGKQYYIPGSTMHKMGYRAPSEYRGVTGEVAPNVLMGGVLVPKSEAAVIQSLSGKKQFERMVQSGIIEEG